MGRSFRVVVLVLLVWSFAPAEELLDLECEAESRVYFSNPTTLDTIVAEIRGGRCEDAIFRVFVTNSAGDRIFEHESPAALLIPCRWVNEDATRARRAYTRIVSTAVSLQRSDGLMCKDADNRFCSNPPGTKHLLEDHVLVMCFNLSNDARACWAYDPEKREVVNVHTFAA